MIINSLPTYLLAFQDIFPLQVNIWDKSQADIAKKILADKKVHFSATCDVRHYTLLYTCIFKLNYAQYFVLVCIQLFI